MKYQCVIFDCDGVLVDSEGITATVIADLSRDLGLEMDETFIHTMFMGKSFNQIMLYLEDQISASLPPNFEHVYRQRTFDAFSRELKPIVGIEYVLNAIGVHFCVASSGPASKIRHNLTVTGLIHHFENKIFSCYDIGCWKPKPDIFLHAARTMGFEPEQCAVVEDSPIGVQAALAGGFDTYVYSPVDTPNQKQPNGAIYFKQMEQLLPLLSR